jgi:rsbT co-antagonist protein RsbR
MSQEAGVCSRPREERLKGCPEAGQNQFFALNEALDQAEVRRIANGVTDFLKSGGFSNPFEDQAFEAKFRNGMEHWLESLLGDDLPEESYAQDRIRIGRSYVKRGLAMTIILKSYSYIRNELMRLLEGSPASMLTALNQRLDDDLSLVLMAYEKEQVRLAEESLSSYRTIQELSSPIIEVSKQTLLVPLVGEMDEQRTDILEDKLLQEVASKKAKQVLMEFSGCEVRDTHLTKRLFEACRAVELLGARVVFVGIRPSLARTLVSIGADSAGFRVVRSLADVLA